MRRDDWIITLIALLLAAAMVLLVASSEPAEAATSTAYSPCSSGTIMADGTPTRPGSAAHNGLALGTRITVRPAPFGRARWTVRDRIGYGTELDLWTASCPGAIAYGRRPVTITVGWPPRRRRVLIGRVLWETRSMGARRG